MQKGHKMKIIRKTKNLVGHMRRMRVLKKRMHGQSMSCDSFLKKNPQPVLSEQEKREIDTYWESFGIRISDYSWHQWLYGVTGIQDPRFIPKPIWMYLVIPYYNSAQFTKAYKDKNLFDRILPEANFPETVLKRINGDFYDADGTYISSSDRDALRKRLLAQPGVICKNAVETGMGLNVSKCATTSAEEADAVLDLLEKGKNSIAQKLVRQHPFFAQFNESSVNIIRVNTWYHEGKVHISTPVLRIGTPGFATDVCFIDGEEIIHMLGITPDGYTRDRIYEMDGTWKPTEQVISPAYQRVPSWDKITEMLQKCASKLPHFRVIGWDITVDESGEPVVIEYNIDQPGPYPSQLTGGPMWGELTDELLSFVKENKNQNSLLPKEYRA